MPGAMPYHLEKGPYLSILESQFNSAQEHLRDQLNLLLDPAAEQWQSDFYDCPALRTGPLPTREALQNHIFNHWFGWTGAVPNYHPQVLSAGCAPAPTTGYWVGYHGDVEKIVRTTLIRAGQVALGVDAKANPINAADIRRHWPVEFFWVCGTDRFEGYVTWRTHAQADGGQVTVVFVTPATPDPLLDDLAGVPLAPDTTTVPGPAPPILPPVGAGIAGPDAMQGLWLVTHTRHSRYVVVQVGGMRFQVVVVPPAFIPPGVLIVAGSYLVVGCGPVATFQPAFRDGGAAPFGLPCEEVPA